MNKIYIFIIKYLSLFIFITLIYNFITFKNAIHFSGKINKCNILYIKKGFFLKKKKKIESLFEKKKYNIGDIILIVIKEKIEINNNIYKEKNIKKEKKKNIITTIPKYFNINLENMNEININNNKNSDYINESTFSEKKIFKFLIPAKIIKILPNGNLYIKGFKKIILNNKKTTVNVYGTINPLYITENNFIISSKIYNLNLKYKTIYENKKENKKSFLKNILEFILTFKF